jgi:acyl carrier protein
VSNVLVKVLAVDQDHVTPSARLQRDLGADSLDLLEIIFFLEQEFSIEIPRGDLFPGSMFRLESELVQDGKLTDKGLAEFRSRLPYADIRNFPCERRLTGISDLFTVGLVGAYVEWKLDRSAGSDKGPLSVLPTDPGDKWQRKGMTVPSAQHGEV